MIGEHNALGHGRIKWIQRSTFDDVMVGLLVAIGNLLLAFRAGAVLVPVMAGAPGRIDRLHDRRLGPYRPRRARDHQQPHHQRGARRESRHLRRLQQAAEHDRVGIANPEWRMPNGEWRMANGEWRTANVERLMVQHRAGAPNPKAEIWNPKSEIRDLKSEIERQIQEISGLS